MDRHENIPGFEQAAFSTSKVVLIGAGGLGGHIAPTLVRKGIGDLLILDPDEVEASNLNRQFFYPTDIGRNKAFALTENLQAESVGGTRLQGFPVSLEEAIGRGIDLSCAVAVCGVDNNPARVLASQHFRDLGVAVVFTGVSTDADHGYVFAQEEQGPCFGCLFPDAVNDQRFPCPGTPAIADILQAVGALAVYAVDTCLTKRKRDWNYRKIQLSGGASDSSQRIPIRSGCPMHETNHTGTGHDDGEQ